jgi:two-component system sensor histidine kinase/response regulator
MKNKDILAFLSEWTSEINETIVKSNSFCVALFSTDGELLFSNPAFSLLVKNEPLQSFINPTFGDLLKIESSSDLIFDGFLTLGNSDALNTSIVAQVYRKNDKLLVTGGIETLQMIKQNSQLADLNREIGNLQREVLNKANYLGNALKELDEFNVELKKEQGTRNKLLSVLAHDLRSPFNAIIGFSELLIDKKGSISSEKSRMYLENINFSAKNTLILLDNLLNWVKSQTGQLSFNPEKVSLSSIIGEIIAVYHSAADMKGISLTYLPSKDLAVYVDQNMLKTILRNLVSNAIKFTIKNGRITISTNQKQDFVEITVSDNGVGINKESLDKLFQGETNQTTSGTANENGSGLGLMLCKEFVEKIGGDIWAESEEGKGSAFKFTLPTKKQNEIGMNP